jgi:hypothetical protein
MAQHGVPSDADRPPNQGAKDGSACSGGAAIAAVRNAIHAVHMKTIKRTVLIGTARFFLATNAQRLTDGFKSL